MTDLEQAIADFAAKQGAQTLPAITSAKQAKATPRYTTRMASDAADARAEQQDAWSPALNHDSSYNEYRAIYGD